MADKALTDTQGPSIAETIEGLIFTTETMGLWLYGLIPVLIVIL